jgi:hypothetical protein
VSRLLAALLKHLRLAVDGEEEPPPADAAPEPAPEPVDDEPTLDDLLPDAQLHTAAPSETPETPRERELRQRLERVEAESRRPVAQAPQQYAPQPYVDPNDVAEERFIDEQRRSGATAEQLRWYEWQRDNNRRLRNAERTAQYSQRMSQEATDRSNFQSFLADKPSFKRLAADVEAIVQQNAANGAPPVARELIAYVLAGKKMADFKPKPKAAKPQTPGNPPPGRVDRGRAPGAGVRSDVTSRARASQSQALRDRLKNQLI